MRYKAIHLFGFNSGKISDVDSFGQKGDEKSGGELMANRVEKIIMCLNKSFRGSIFCTFGSMHLYNAKIIYLGSSFLILIF